MATLDDIVSVQIALQTTGVTRATFGIPMIVSPLLSFPERVRVYTSYASASEDNLPQPLLTALSDCFAQTPHPAQVKVGRRAISKGVINITAVNLATYKITVGTTEYSYTADGTALASEIATGLALAVTSASNQKITATAVGDTVEVAWISQSDLSSVALSENLAWGTISPLTSATAMADDLSAILDEDSAWYGLVMTERTKQDQLNAAEWTEANQKLFITATNEADVLVAGTTTDLLSLLKDTRYFRTAAIYHADADTQYPDAAWAGRVFTIAPGGETWALKSLSSITASKITATQRQTIYNKGGNTFEFYQSQIALTNPGKVAAGEWIDVIRFRDWLKDTIQVNMTQMLINRDKLPYTNAGIQVAVNNLRASLQEGVNAGGIAGDELDSAGKTVPGYIITFPNAIDVPNSVKDTRILELGFKARIAGAIHAVNVTGSLAYEL